MIFSKQKGIFFPLIAILFILIFFFCIYVIPVTFILPVFSKTSIFSADTHSVFLYWNGNTSEGIYLFASGSDGAFVSLIFSISVMVNLICIPIILLTLIIFPIFDLLMTRSNYIIQSKKEINFKKLFMLIAFLQAFHYGYLSFFMYIYNATSNDIFQSFFPYVATIIFFSFGWLSFYFSYQLYFAHFYEKNSVKLNYISNWL